MSQHMTIVDLARYNSQAFAHKTLLVFERSCQKKRQSTTEGEELRLATEYRKRLRFPRLLSQANAQTRSLHQLLDLLQRAERG